MVDLISVFEGVGAYQAGKIDQKRLKTLEDYACPSCGSCSGMFTANSMNCLMEALGLALPYNGSALALTPEREALARRAGHLILELVRRQIKPRDIVTLEAWMMRSRWTWLWEGPPTHFCMGWPLPMKPG